MWIGESYYRGHVLRTIAPIAIVANMLVATSAASAQTAASATVGVTAPDATVEQVIVTGVRGQPRSVADSPTPVDVVGAADLADAGQAGLYQDIQTLVPSFDVPTRAGGGTPTVIATGSLRGLDPDQTLVLVNGLRWHHTSLINTGLQLYNGSVPVDLSMIPTSAIDHIEVLREGAAAQYGSDAIAGVINIILKDSPGGSFSAQDGQNFDRHDGQLLLLNGYDHFDFLNNGSLNLFFSNSEQSQSNRTTAVSTSVQLFPSLPNGQPDPREATFPRNFGKAYGVDPYNLTQFGYDADDQIGNLEFYSNAILNNRLSTIPYPLVSADNAVSLPQVYPNGFYPQFKISEHDGQLAAGVRGALQGWNWDLSSTAGEDWAKERMYSDINASLGPTSPTTFHIGTLISQEWVNSLDVTRKFDLPDAGSLQVSFGLQDRFEAYQVNSGDPASYAVGGYIIPTGQPFAGTLPTPEAYYTPGFRPQDSGRWTRNVYALYGELGYTPDDKLLVELSTRYENYSDSSGGSLVGKFDGRYKLTDWFSLRASIGNGFHAPALAQEHYSNAKVQLSASAATLGQLLTTETVPVDSPLAITLGATPLRPETSVDKSVGFTLNPLSNFDITVDGYQVDVFHRIALTGVLSGAALNNILTSAGYASGTSAQYFTNAVNTETSGVDIVGTFRQELGNWGNLRLTTAFNYNNTSITHIIPNPPALAALGSSYVLFDQASQGFLTASLPKSKVVLGANWLWNRIGLKLNEVRYGDYTIVNDTPSLSRTFPAAWITDFEATYHLTEPVSFTVGANNLFNVYPPATALATPTLGQGQYPQESPFAYTGGYYYGRIRIDF
jgi:iron complex outermembrane recepter protein